MKAFTSALYSLGVTDKVRNYMKACLGAAIHTNKNNPAGLSHDVLNKVDHAYGEHTRCGSWCDYAKDPQNYKHSGLPGGANLTCVELRSSLGEVFRRIAGNSKKIAPLGLTQRNENINQIVATKHPKSRSYAGSVGLKLRVQAGVCQKNDGQSYVQEVVKLADLSPGNETKKYRSKRDKCREERHEKQGTVVAKRRRLFNKRNKSTRNANLEQREGITYETECGLDGIADLVDDPSIATRLPIDAQTIPVYVHLETTGLSKNSCEILQIAARSEGDVFNAYILPTKSISRSASIVTGIKTSGGELFKDGQVLVTTPPKKAFLDFIAFLKSKGERVLLVAHNGNSFDAPIILRDARKYATLPEFLTVVAGFVDSLEVMKAHLPTKKESFKLVSLAHLYKVTADDAHDATAGVKMLQEIISAAGVSYATLLRHSKTVAAIVQNEDRLAKRSLYETSLQCLKPIVTANMVKKIANAGISLAALQEAYRKGADRGLDILLRESVDNKPRVTNVKSKVSDIIQAVKTTMQQ